MSTPEPASDYRVDGDEDTRLAKTMRFSFENCIIITTSILLLIVATVGFVMATAAPVAITGAGLIISTSVNDVYEHDYARIDTKNGLASFRDNANIAEGMWNLVFLGISFMLDVWNYSLHVLYLLYEIFQNIAVDFFKTVMDPKFVPELMEFFSSLGRIAKSIPGFGSVSSAFGAVSGTVGDYPVYGEDPGQVFGAGDSATGSPSIPDALTVRMWYFYNFLMDILTQSTTETVGELFNFLSAPVIKRLPSIIKFIADLAGIITPGGYWSNYLIGDISLIQIRSLIDLSTCFGEYLFYDIVCAVEIGVAGVLNGLAISMRLGTPYTPTCRAFEIPRHCSLTSLITPVDRIDQITQTQDLFDFVFSPVKCDELDCTFFMLDLLPSLQAHNNTCAFWVTSPSAVFDCMLLVSAYSDVNNTMASKADPSTLAAEICFVLFAKNTASCTVNALPFVYSFDDVADDICSTSKTGASISNCTCTYNAPLCIGDCCSTYATHVHTQTLAQIGDRTCAEVDSMFSRNKVWCPLLAYANTTDVSPFFDNTYTHMWCSFYDDVIGNLCSFVSGFTRVVDLQINVVFPAYAATACNRTVNQAAVCVPLNATVDQLAVDIILGQQATTTIDIFLENDQLPYTSGVPIITQFLPTDDAQAIKDKTRRKHFCQQFSEANKNDNIMSKSKPWRVKSHASSYCDEQVLVSDFDINIAASTFFKYATSDGLPVPVTLQGVPPNWPAFSELVNPNYQSEVCTAPVGPNVVEANAFEACMQRLRQRYYEQGLSQAQITSSTLTLWSQQALYITDFVFLNGVYPIDPLDPEYDQKIIELERLVTMLNTDLNYTATAYKDILPASPPWRNNVTAVPPEGSIDNDDPGVPFPQMQSLNLPPGSRILLSIDYDDDSPLPPAPNHFIAFRKLASRIFPSWGRSKTVNEKAREYKTKKRVQQIGEAVYDNLYLKPKKDYADHGYDIDKVDYFPATRRTMRKLAMTGDPQKDAFITSVFGVFATTPTEPVGMTKQMFKLFLEEDIYNHFARLFDLTLNVAVPGIFRSLMNFIDGTYANDVNTYYGTDYAFTYEFGKSDSGQTRCISEMSKPYKCCLASSNSYECCYGLIGCIPIIPKTWYQEKTTNENCAARWKCQETKSFLNWWTHFFQMIATGFYELTVYFIGHEDTYRSMFSWALLPDHPPRNFIFCMSVHAYNLFVGVFLVFIAYLLLASQGLSLLIANMTRFQTEQMMANQKSMAQIEAQIKEIKIKKGLTVVAKIIN